MVDVLGLKVLVSMVRGGVCVCTIWSEGGMGGKIRLNEEID